MVKFAEQNHFSSAMFHVFCLTFILGGTTDFQETYVVKLITFKSTYNLQARKICHKIMQQWDLQFSELAALFCLEEELRVDGEMSVKTFGISGHSKPKSDTKISFISL